MSCLTSLLLIAPANSIHTVRWANALAESGLAVTVATCVNHVPPHEDAYSADVRIQLLPFKSPWGYFLNAPHLQKLLRENHFDLVHAHYATGSGMLLSFLSHPRTFLSVWGSDVYDFPRASRLHKALLGRNLRKAGVVVSTSHSMAEHTRKLFPFLAAVPVVPFGVDTARFSPSISSEALTSQASGVFRVGLCKALEPKYGVDVLLEAFALLKSQWTLPMRLELCIAGTGTQLAALQAQAQALCIASDVHFLGRIPNIEVPQFLAGLGVFCALSVDDSESFGVAVVEAMSCGVPVVVSNVSGFQEVVVDGECGFVVPRRDAVAASNALWRLAINSPLRKSFGIAGRERVLTCYDWRQNVAEMIGIYHSLPGAPTEGEGV